MLVVLVSVICRLSAAQAFEAQLHAEGTSTIVDHGIANTGVAVTTKGAMLRLEPSRPEEGSALSERDQELLVKTARSDDGGLVIVADDGSPGPQGPPGPMGAIIGPHGFPGAPGQMGEKGNPGPQGHRGVNGTGILGQMGATGANGAPGPTGVDGPRGEQGPWGPPGAPGDQPRELAEWETNLDSYDAIVAALETHSETLRDKMDKKHEMVGDKIQQLRMRLASLANGTVSLNMMSKEMVKQMNGVAKAGEETSFNAAHLRKLFTGGVREAEKLASVAADTELAKEKCKDCKENSAWSSHVSALVILGFACVWR